MEESYEQWRNSLDDDRTDIQKIKDNLSFDLQVLDDTMRTGYKTIVLNVIAFIKDCSSLTPDKKITMLLSMITYFEQTEEYEKCGKLLKVQTALSKYYEVV